MNNTASAECGAAFLDNINESKRDEQAIRELAELTPLQYDRVREERASELGAQLSTLDKEVKAARKDIQADRFELEAPEPWLEPVNGPEVLNDVADMFNSYLVLPEGAAEVLALWAAYTHAFDAFVHSPRLNITSPEKECGKTLLLDVIETVTPRPIRSEGITTAVLIRIIDKKSPIILIDEYDTFLTENRELGGALNAGHKRGGQHLRCEGDNNEITAYKTFCPVALAGIRDLPATLASRSIVIQLKRALKGEVRKRFDSRHTDREKELNRKLARWAKDNFSSLQKSDPPMPPDLFNRQADNWRPLFSIAEAAGPEWIERAKAALVSLRREESEDTAGIMLLEDIRSLFNELDIDKITSKELVEHLVKMEERPWPEFGKTGKEITTRKIAKLLKPFGIKPETHRFGEDTHKGYELEPFKDVFRRFLDDLSVTPSQLSKDGQYGENAKVTDVTHVTDQSVTDVTEQNDRKPAQDKDCYRVTDQTVPRERVTV